MARKRKARKAKSKRKLLPLGRCMKSHKRCFKIVKKGKRRVIKSCKCTANTPSKSKLRK